MSGIGDERWRNSRGQLPTQSQPNQRPKQGASRKGSYNNNPQEKSGDKPNSVNAMAPGNAWGNDLSKGEPGNATTEPQTAVAGFNAKDTRDLLKRGKTATFGVKAILRVRRFRRRKSTPLQSAHRVAEHENRGPMGFEAEYDGIRKRFLPRASKTGFGVATK
ncbi:hypothetical protein MMC11_000182 [Xylographa trunciseda]|nr:hypothetical protein [Xylographa trunciseda]